MHSSDQASPVVTEASASFDQRAALNIMESLAEAVLGLVSRLPEVERNEVRQGIDWDADDNDDVYRYTYTCECGDQLGTSGTLKAQGWGCDEDGCYCCRACSNAPQDFGETLGRRLRNLRDLQDLTLDEVATAAGLSASYLSQLERDEKTDPSARIVQRLAHELRVDMETLLGAEPVPTECQKCRRRMALGSGVPWENDVGETIEVCDPCHALLVGGDR